MIKLTEEQTKAVYLGEDIYLNDEVRAIRNDLLVIHDAAAKEVRTQIEGEQAFIYTPGVLAMVCSIPLEVLRYLMDNEEYDLLNNSVLQTANWKDMECNFSWCLSLKHAKELIHVCEDSEEVVTVLDCDGEELEILTWRA